MKEIYPLTVVKDRYNGAYSGGKYTAWNVDSDRVPEDIHGGDIECMQCWENSVFLYVIGRGETIQEAIDDLTKQLGE